MTITEDAPEVVRLKAASETSGRATAALMALDGYLPVDYPNRRTLARRVRLVAAAEAEFARASNELHDARDAVIMMPRTH
jgi:hypothetical protein